MNNLNAVQGHSNRFFEVDHTETVTRLISAVTMFDPVKVAVGYLIPWLGAWTGNHVEIRKNDRLQRALLDQESILNVVDELKTAAGISRDITTYASLYYNCLSYGGSCSLSSPIVSIPLSFCRNPPADDGPEVDQIPEYWTFHADEVAFFIAREMAHIKSNDALTRIASKMLLVASLFFFFAVSASLLIAGSLMLSSTILYLLSERYVHGKLDIQAIHILTTYFNGDQDKAVQVASSALQKLINQNIEREETKSWYNTFYLTKAGNNLLDLDHPLLTNRLSRVQEHFNS